MGNNKRHRRTYEPPQTRFSCIKRVIIASVIRYALTMPSGFCVGTTHIAPFSDNNQILSNSGIDIQRSNSYKKGREISDKACATIYSTWFQQCVRF